MPPGDDRASLAAKLDKATDTIRLNETKSYTLTLTPAGGLTGGVTLALDNPPAGVTAKIHARRRSTSPTPPRSPSRSTSPSHPTATPTTSASVSVKAVSGSINASASLGVTVPAELLIHVRQGRRHRHRCCAEHDRVQRREHDERQVRPGPEGHLRQQRRASTTRSTPRARPTRLASRTRVARSWPTPATRTRRPSPGRRPIKSSDWRCHIHANMVGSDAEHPVAHPRGPAAAGPEYSTPQVGGQLGSQSIPTGFVARRLNTNRYSPSSRLAVRAPRLPIWPPTCGELYLVQLPAFTNRGRAPSLTRCKRGWQRPSS